MGWQDWSAWVAMRAVITAYARTPSRAYEDVDGFLRSARLRLDGSKGVGLSFRTWSGQLRQPILLTTDNATIAMAPLEGFLHESNTLDTLGIDEREFVCD
jgi:ABC transporter substrate binding protein (PQQ-dependent alcohol dehydrogenase system)